MTFQNSMKRILADETSLQEIVQLVGKDSLSEDQQVTIEPARLIINRPLRPLNRM